MTVESILKAAARKSVNYYLDNKTTVTLTEMSYAYQQKWAQTDFKKTTAYEFYIELIANFCEELKGVELDKLRDISPSHIIGMGNAIAEMSSIKKE